MILREGQNYNPKSLIVQLVEALHQTIEDVL
jgi:hypothetical protein